jgi:hypothetical protein
VADVEDLHVLELPFRYIPEVPLAPCMVIEELDWHDSAILRNVLQVRELAKLSSVYV